MHFDCQLRMLQAECIADTRCAVCKQPFRNLVLEVQSDQQLQIYAGVVFVIVLLWGVLAALLLAYVVVSRRWFDPMRMAVVFSGGITIFTATMSACTAFLIGRWCDGIVCVERLTAHWSAA